MSQAYARKRLQMRSLRHQESREESRSNYCSSLCAAHVATVKVDKGEDSDGFYQAKIDADKFYFQRMMLRAEAHRISALAGAESLMEIAETGFDF